VQRDERVAEIARMLGGERATETTLAHAREMLDGAASAPAMPPPQPLPVTTSAGKR